MRRVHWISLGILLSTALAVRLLWSLVLGANTPFGDEAEYLGDARLIYTHQPVVHQNWMLFIRAPGYSYFLATVWTLAGGESRVSIHVAQAILSTATCAFVFALARRIGASPIGALVATAFASFHPFLVYMVAPLGTEAVFAFFVVSGAYFLVAGLDSEASRDRWWRLALSGLLLGIGNMFRPNLQTILPLVALWLVIRYRRRLRLAVATFAVLVFPIIAVALPWSLAVERAGYGWVWVTDGGAVWYFIGHNDLAYDLYCAETPSAPRSQLIRLGEAQITHWPGYLRAKAAPIKERQREFWKVALEWDRAHLYAEPCLAFTKLYSFWRPWVNRDAYPLKMFLVSLASAPPLLLGLWGTWLAFRRGERTATIFTWMVAGSGTFVAVVFSTEIRYRIPMVDVLLIPFVGMVVDRAFPSLRGDART